MPGWLAWLTAKKVKGGRRQSRERRRGRSWRGPGGGGPGMSARANGVGGSLAVGEACFPSAFRGVHNRSLERRRFAAAQRSFESSFAVLRCLLASTRFAPTRVLWCSFVLFRCCEKPGCKLRARAPRGRRNTYRPRCVEECGFAARLSRLLDFGISGCCLPCVSSCRRAFVSQRGFCFAFCHVRIVRGSTCGSSCVILWNSSDVGERGSNVEMRRCDVEIWRQGELVTPVILELIFHKPSVSWFT